MPKASAFSYQELFMVLVTFLPDTNVEPLIFKRVNMNWSSPDSPLVKLTSTPEPNELTKLSTFAVRLSTWPGIEVSSRADTRLSKSKASNGLIPQGSTGNFPWIGTKQRVKLNWAIMDLYLEDSGSVSQYGSHPTKYNPMIVSVFWFQGTELCTRMFITSL